MIETCRPRLRREKAISIPRKLPPSTTASLEDIAACLIVSASFLARSVWIPESVMPGIEGHFGIAPVAIRSWP
jgi:hypothetical protein